MSGILYVIATPIGNLEDITLRSLRLLKTVEHLACEDTRTTRSLLQKLQIEIHHHLFSYHEHNEAKATEKMINLLHSGVDVGLVSDAGMPGISDPGYRVVSRAVDEGFKVEVAPGASAVQTALIASGLPFSSYTFKGFPPRKEGKRRRFFEEEKELPHTIIFFESKFRIIKAMESAYAVLGNRIAVVCIELTKQYETIIRAPLSEMREKLEQSDLRGEITALIAGSNPKFTDDENDELDADTQESEEFEKNKKVSKYKMKQADFEDDDEES
ncbi:16S rRNA (cytidine(1402)-2'-O)-methyltransferase [Ignavibacteriales bacterium]